MTPSDARTRPDPAAPAAAGRSAARRAAARRPPALRPGDRVAVLSVSSPADPARLAIGLDALRFAGLDPVLCQTFPIGVAAELDADAAALRLLDPPLRPAAEQARRPDRPERPVSRGRRLAPGPPGH